MRLRKGQRATLTGGEMSVTLIWSRNLDLELAAVYETKSGAFGIVYFDDLGSRDCFPFIACADDEVGGGEDGVAEEEIVIKQVSEMKYIYIFCWEYGDPNNGEGGMVEGIPAKFAESDVTLTIEDDRGGTWEIALDEVGADANVCCVATIDNSGDDVELINTSKTGLLHGLDNLGQLVDIAQKGRVWITHLP